MIKNILLFSALSSLIGCSNVVPSVGIFKDTTPSIESANINADGSLSVNGANLYSSSTYVMTTASGRTVPLVKESGNNQQAVLRAKDSVSLKPKEQFSIKVANPLTQNTFPIVIEVGGSGSSTTAISPSQISPGPAGQILLSNGSATSWGPISSLSIPEIDPSVKAFAKTDLPACDGDQSLTTVGGNLTCVKMKDDTKLSLGGGSLSGSINMNGNSISGLPLNPTESSSPISKDYADAKLLNKVLAGSSFTIVSGAATGPSGSIDLQTLVSAPYNSTAGPKGAGSAVVGGSNNRASGLYSAIIGGVGAVASTFGEIAHATGFFSSPGDAQSSVVHLRCESNGINNPCFLSPRFGDSTDSDVAFKMIANGAISCDLLVVGITETGTTYHFKTSVSASTNPDSASAGPERTQVGGSSVSTNESNMLASVSSGNLKISIKNQYFNKVRWSARMTCAQVAL